MTTTHSPMFIDLTKDHTTIIRIERTNGIKRTVKFTPDDRENLKMINFCNPYINEFFFADYNLLVEGETEYSVVKSLLNEGRIQSSIHVLNCIGKGNIPTVSKILNHFSVPYSILHDSDNPTILRDGSKVRNGAWTMNQKILAEVIKGREKGIQIKTFVSIPNFEGDFLDGIKGGSKPYEAWKYFREENENTRSFFSLLTYIAGESGESCANEYHDISSITSRVQLHTIEKNLEENDHWDLEYGLAFT